MLPFLGLLIQTVEEANHLIEAAEVLLIKG